MDKVGAIYLEIKQNPGKLTDKKPETTPVMKED